MGSVLWTVALLSCRPLRSHGWWVYFFFRVSLLRQFWSSNDSVRTGSKGLLRCERWVQQTCSKQSEFEIHTEIIGG